MDETRCSQNPDPDQHTHLLKTYRVGHFPHCGRMLQEGTAVQLTWADGVLAHHSRKDRVEAAALWCGWHRGSHGSGWGCGMSGSVVVGAGGCLLRSHQIINRKRGMPTKAAPFLPPPLSFSPGCQLKGWDDVIHIQLRLFLISQFSLERPRHMQKQCAFTKGLGFLNAINWTRETDSHRPSSNQPSLHESKKWFCNSSNSLLHP